MRRSLLPLCFVFVVTPLTLQPVLADVLMDVGEGRECPSFTQPIGDGYCKAIVNNKFTGAYLNGGCPHGSGPVGQGYCMYDYD